MEGTERESPVDPIIFNTGIELIPVIRFFSASLIQFLSFAIFFGSSIQFTCVSENAH